MRIISSYFSFAIKRKKTLFLLSTVFLLLSCASTEQEETPSDGADINSDANSQGNTNYSGEEAEANPFNGGDYGNNPYAEDGNSSGEAGNNSISNDSYENPYAEKNAAKNDYENPYANPAAGNGLGNSLALEDAPINTTATNNTIPINPIPSNLFSSNPLANSTAIPTEPEAPVDLLSGPTGPASIPTGGARVVKYATAPLTATAGPGSGLTIRVLEKGDHPLVIDDQPDYARLSNGSYIDAKGLSNTGVGRDRLNILWK